MVHANNKSNVRATSPFILAGLVERPLCRTYFRQAVRAD